MLFWVCAPRQRSYYDTSIKHTTTTKPTKTTNQKKELADLVKRLLVRRPALRLGARPGGADDVKRHAWFAGFDWAAFEARALPAPYVPKVLIIVFVCVMMRAP